jgi:hypothetical protein
MIHFLLANNLLMSLGGHFYVANPDFGCLAERHGLGAPMRLEALATSCLERFVVFEAPSGGGGDECVGSARGSRRYASVSQLYRMIRNSFVAHPDFIMARRGETGGEHHLFMSRKTNKYHPDFQCQVDDVTSALFAIQALTEQGEGASPDDEAFDGSHWQRFQRMLGRLEQFERELGAVVCYPCVANPSQAQRTGMTPITNPQTLEVLRMFNVSYEISMQLMLQHFCLMPRATLRRSRLMNASIDIMAYLMAPLGVALMSLQSGTPGRTAGPSFELPYPLQFIPDHQVAQRHLSRKLDELAELAANNAAVPRDVVDLSSQYAEYTKVLA